MLLVIQNITGSTKTYLSGTVIVPANSSTSITNTVYILALTLDGQLRHDLLTNQVIIGDGTNSFGGTDAINYLYELIKAIGPITDSIGTILTSSNNALNVNVVNTQNTQSNNNLLLYNKISSVPTNVLTNILTYTIPSTPTGFYFSLAEVSGTQIASFNIAIDGIEIAKKYTYWGSGFNLDFEFQSYKLSIGQVITINVLNGQPDMGDFQARILGNLI